VKELKETSVEARAEALIDSGWAYMRERQYDHALADYDTAIKLDPTRQTRIFSRSAALRTG
jgi:hypothetical protein